MPFLDSAELSRREPFAGYAGRFIHSEHVTLADWTIAPGAEFPEHAHPHDQVMLVVDGRFELTIDGDTRVLNSGDVAIIPSGARHSGRAVTPCHVIDVFHPVRDDYR